MPQPVAELEEPHPILGRHDFPVFVEIGEISDAGAEPLLAALADMTGCGIALELAEVAGEGDLLLVADVLFAKDENGVFIHPLVDCTHFRWAERLPAIDTGDLADEHRMERADRNGHRRFPSER